MKTPFRNSNTARLLLVAVAIGLLGTGAVSALGLNAWIVLPMVFIVSVLLAIAALFQGVADHPGECVLAGAVGLPFFWIYVMGSIGAIGMPTVGMAFAAGGILPVLLLVFATRSTSARPAASQDVRHASA
jgi:hypothetical protein